jgi:DNA adenine methylase
MIRAANISSIPQRSPFRYPGGKTWLIPQVRTWLKFFGGENIQLIEPFAGGGIVTLTSVMEGLVGSALMIELDPDVAAVWRAIFGRKARALAEKVKKFNFTKESVVATLESKPKNIIEHAFHTILKNRVTRNGILASGAGMIKKGEYGYGLKSRWYPNTLSDRILLVAKYRRQISFKHCDGLLFLEKCIPLRNFVYFIDPPYSKIGKRLYKCGEIDHEKLFNIVSHLEGNFLMTYKKSNEAIELAKKYHFQTEEIYMNGGLNSTKIELLIARDLNWISDMTSKKSKHFHRRIEDSSTQILSFTINDSSRSSTVTLASDFFNSDFPKCRL